MADSAVEGAKELLTKRIGPLPAWAVYAALVGAFAYYIRRKSAAKNAAGTTSGSGTSSDVSSAASQYSQAGPMPYSGGDTYLSIINKIPTPASDEPKTPAPTPEPSPNYPPPDNSPVNLPPAGGPPNEIQPWTQRIIKRGTFAQGGLEPLLPSDLPQTTPLNSQYSMH